MGVGRWASGLGERQDRCWIHIHRFKYDLGHICGLMTGGKSPGSALPPLPSLDLPICQMGSHSNPPDPLRRHSDRSMKRAAQPRTGKIWETHQERGEPPQGLAMRCSPLMGSVVRSERRVSWGTHSTDSDVGIPGKLYALGRLFIHSPTDPSLHPPKNPPIHPFICLSATHLSIHQSVHLSIYPSIQLSAYSSIRLSIHPNMHASIYLPIIHSSFYPPIHPSMHPCIHLSTYSSIIHPSIYLFIHSTLHPPKYPSIHLSTQLPSIH